MADAKSSFKRSKQNVCERIIKRSLLGSSARTDMGILKTLISSKSRTFSKTWSKMSKNPIGFDNQHLFFEKFRTVYTTNGNKGKPSLLYQLPTLRSKEKVESAVIFETPLDQSSLQECEVERSFRPCLLAVTASGILLRQDIQSGEILQSVYLGKSYKFKHIVWETDLCRLAITSVHRPKPPRAAQDESTSVVHTLMYIAVFEVAPLKFLAVIPINMKIFGNNLVDASLSNGVLFTMHQGGIMKLFSLKEILENCTTEAVLGTTFNFSCGGLDEGKQGTVGEMPYGVPVNTKFEKQPSLLLQVSSHRHFLSFGGFPWHYVASPKGQSSVFEVFTISNQKAVHNGLLNSGLFSIEQDHASFHADHSGRILHVGPDFVSYHKLTQCSSDQQGLIHKFELKPCYKISMEKTSSTTDNAITYTSSGRKVVCNTQSNSQYETVRDFDYEDELDFLVVLSSLDSSGGRIGLYDNQTGLLVKEFMLPSWDEDGDHSVLMERDIIVHICKSVTRKFYCNVFRLTKS